MLKTDFHYDLPGELIAQEPSEPRSASRLLCVDAVNNSLQDRLFKGLLECLHPSDLLVFNDTRVIPARVYGEKDTGGHLELLVERLLDAQRLVVQLRVSKPPRPGQVLHLQGQVHATVIARRGEFWEICLEDGQPAWQVLERIGHMPLPPYIERPASVHDRERYQTVYARHPGAVAAPTAGLHFDEPLLARLDEHGIERAFITLHVGAGTFQPLRADDIRQHRMHKEFIDISMASAECINQAHRAGRRVVAVGTTVVRALESATQAGQVCAMQGETDIFIYPGYRFQMVDALITNFHLPGSTLLMLVCAFAGRERVLQAYRHAVTQRYRFFSYGDAMWLTLADASAGSA